MIREVLPPDTGSAFRAMKALRTDLVDEEAFVRAVDDVQRVEGYRLVGEFEDGESQAAAVAGFRICHSIVWSHYLMSTISRRCRRQGDAGTLGRCSIGYWRRRVGWAATSFTSTPASARIAPTPTGSL